jgi:hypothetical protein
MRGVASVCLKAAVASGGAPVIFIDAEPHVRARGEMGRAEVVEIAIGVTRGSIQQNRRSIPPRRRKSAPTKARMALGS